MSIANRMKEMEIKISNMAKRLDAIEQAFDGAEEEAGPTARALDGSHSGRERDESQEL